MVEKPYALRYKDIGQILIAQTAIINEFRSLFKVARYTFQYIQEYNS